MVEWATMQQSDSENVQCCVGRSSYSRESRYHGKHSKFAGLISSTTSEENRAEPFRIIAPGSWLPARVFSGPLSLTTSQLHPSSWKFTAITRPHT